MLSRREFCLASQSRQRRPLLVSSILRFPAKRLRSFKASYVLIWSHFRRLGSILVCLPKALQKALPLYRFNKESFLQPVCQSFGALRETAKASKNEENFWKTINAPHCKSLIENRGLCPWLYHNFPMNWINEFQWIKANGSEMQC